MAGWILDRISLEFFMILLRFLKFNWKFFRILKDLFKFFFNFFNLFFKDFFDDFLMIFLGFLKILFDIIYIFKFFL